MYKYDADEMTSVTKPSLSNVKPVANAWEDTQLQGTCLLLRTRDPGAVLTEVFK